MLRYKLRTLLIVLAILPPVLTVSWWGYGKWRVEQERKELVRGGRVSKQTYPIEDSYLHGEALAPKPIHVDLP